VAASGRGGVQAGMLVQLGGTRITPQFQIAWHGLRAPALGMPSKSEVVYTSIANRHFCDGHHIPIARSSGNICAEITEAQRGSTAMSGIDVLGYLAALAVLAAFCMSSIVPLRIVAILSNVLFALYGLSAHLYPIFLLHSILLPINVLKLAHLELLPQNSRSWSAAASGLRSRIKAAQR
jgi:hypothetical protein